MAKINFEQINSNNDSGTFQVGFFNLKNNGDEAIVRIMHDSVDSFDLVTTHPIQVGNKYRRVNCIRDPRDPMDNCPLCKSGVKVQQRFYIHLIQYVNDEQGNIVPQAKIWERSASYAVTIKNLIDEYGTLSDYIFKIRRNGEAGSMNTTYSIIFGNPQVYKPEFYPKDDSLFDGYSVVGSAVMDKNFDELAEFVATGEFPASQQVNNRPPVEPSVPYSVTNTAPVFAGGTASSSNTPTSNMQTPMRENPNTHMVDNTNNVTGVQRPVRYY